jgi:hypothetical protein
MRPTSAPPEDTFRIVGLGRWRAILMRTHVLIVGYRPGMTHEEMHAADWSGSCETPMLFDRTADPGQTRNLAAEQPKIVRDLYEILATTTPLSAD